MAGLDDVGQKEVREPQSDEEESKENNSFGKKLSNHGQMFVNALKNLEIVQENDLAGLKAGKDYQLREIDRLAKFKSKCEEPIK